MIEGVYPIVLKLEQLQRREGFSTSGTTWPLHNDDEDTDPENMMIVDLWTLLELEGEQVSAMYVTPI